MKKKVKKKRQNSGNNIQLEYQKRIDNEYVIDLPIILGLMTSMSPFGSDDFVWEGDHDGEKITVTLPRQTSEGNATITNLPNIQGLRDQVYAEIKRILRQLN